MTVESHILANAGKSFVADGDVIRGKVASPGVPVWEVTSRILRGGRSEGVQVIELDNGSICIDVLPTRGMGIWRVRKFPSPLGGGAAPQNASPITLGWRAPSHDPIHPAFVPLMEPAGLGWLDGFNELLCRCGLESNGPPEFDDAGRLLRPLHGRIANTPAHRVELLVDEVAGVITLRGVVDESRFHFQSLRLTASISTKIGSNEFTWTDEVENIGGRDAMMQMLYHFNLGQPLLQSGANVHAPIATIAPLTQIAADEGIDTWNIIPPPRPGSAEQVYVADLAADQSASTGVLVTGLADDNALCLRWNKQALPCFTLWRNTPAESDGYVVGLEPGTNYPNPRTFENEQGRVRNLKAGEKWSATVTATWHTEASEIAEVKSAIESLQKTAKPEFAPQPRNGWTASL